MKISKTLIAATAVTMVSTFSIAQAAPQIANRILTLGSIVNGANGVIIKPTTTNLPESNNASIVKDCDTDDSDTLHDINQYKRINIQQDSAGNPFNFSYTYYNKADRTNTCVVAGSFDGAGNIQSLTATSTGSGFSCCIGSGGASVLNSQVFYEVDFY